MNETNNPKLNEGGEGERLNHPFDKMVEQATEGILMKMSDEARDADYISQYLHQHDDDESARRYAARSVALDNIVHCWQITPSGPWSSATAANADNPDSVKLAYPESPVYTGGRGGDAYTASILAQERLDANDPANRRAIIEERVKDLASYLGVEFDGKMQESIVVNDAVERLMFAFFDEGDDD